MQTLRLLPPDSPEESDTIQRQRDDSADAGAVMRRLAGGERAALDDLLQTYWGAVVAYVSRTFGYHDLDAAHDVAQDAFWRVWERRGEWRGGSVRAYLFRVARNLYLDELRRTQARERAELRSEVAEGRSPRTPDSFLEGDELTARVDRILHGMSARRREAFTLVYLHGLSYREAADVMDVSVKTLGNHLTAALAELRMRLGHFLDPSIAR